MEHAYSTLVVKSLDDDQGLIEGIASTVHVDRDRDIVVPEGATFVLPLPLLLHHDHRQPIGTVTHATVTSTAIKIKARIERAVGGYVEQAWKLIKAGALRGLSIGFVGVDVEPLPNGGRRYKRWDWAELSAVSVPANVAASISVVKTFSEASRTGQKPRISASDLITTVDEPSDLAAFAEQFKQMVSLADDPTFRGLVKGMRDDPEIAEAVTYFYKAAHARSQAEAVVAQFHAVMALMAYREREALGPLRARVGWLEAQR